MPNYCHAYQPPPKISCRYDSLFYVWRMYMYMYMSMCMYMNHRPTRIAPPPKIHRRAIYRPMYIYMSYI